MKTLPFLVALALLLGGFSAEARTPRSSSAKAAFKMEQLWPATVELAGLTWGKHQTDKGALASTPALCLPLLYETLDAVVGAGVAFSLQIFE